MTSSADRIKRMVRSLSPPIIIDVYRNLVRFLSKHEHFESWWKKEFPEKKELPPILISMVDHFITTPSFKTSSKYWSYLNQKNIQQISDYGYENFKQTVAKNYFTWVGGLATSYSRNLLKNIESLNTNVPIKEILKKHELFTLQESVLYNVITVLLLEYVKQNERASDYLNVIEESEEGNSPFLSLSGRRISQDILNSILEYISISKGCEIDKVSSIIEIGAGSGRTSFCLLKLLPNVKYVIADIPPALFISQSYLSNTFKDKNIFSFRPFKSFSEVEDEFKASDIIFLMPHQLDLLPDKTYDLFLAIDCLHEMKEEQIELYFNHVDRLAKSFYFKCWQKTEIPFDNICLSSEDYPIKVNWHQIYKKPCKVPAAYFEAFYDIG